MLYNQKNQIGIAMNEINENTPAKRKVGRPRKEIRRKPNVKNKRVRRATTTDFDVTSSAHCLWQGAMYLEEMFNKLNLHYDFKTSMMLLINKMKGLATGLSLHLDNPNKEAFKTEVLTKQEFDKAEQYRKHQIAKQLAQNPLGTRRVSQNIHFD
jgi:hypothetical protein